METIMTLPVSIAQRPIMYILTVDWDLRALWMALTITARVYLLCLLVAVVYAAIRLIQALINLHVRGRKSLDSVELARMRRGTDSVRQLTLLMLFLFGMVFANEMFAGIRSIKYSAASLSALTIDVFEPSAAFAFVVFCTLSLLHGSQWLITGRVQAVSRD
jgi:hypothetical protein